MAYHYQILQYMKARRWPISVNIILVNTVPVDGLTPKGAGSYAGTMMTHYKCLSLSRSYAYWWPDTVMCLDICLNVPLYDDARFHCPFRHKCAIWNRAKSLIYDMWQVCIRNLAYLLTDGVVYSFGYTCAQLGRSTRRVPAIMFGEVPITEPILAMACGSSHCLAMSASKVRYAIYGGSDKDNQSYTVVNVGQIINLPWKSKL